MFIKHMFTEAGESRLYRLWWPKWGNDLCRGGIRYVTRSHTHTQTHTPTYTHTCTQVHLYTRPHTAHKVWSNAMLVPHFTDVNIKQRASFGTATICGKYFQYSQAKPNSTTRLYKGRNTGITGILYFNRLMTSHHKQKFQRSYDTKWK